MPPAATMNVQSYCNLLTRSRLLTPDEVKDSYRRWQETRKRSDDEVDSFRKYLVSRKLLTEYQSHLIMRGHSDGFFIDQYKILDLIAKGSMAGVYKAVHQSGQVVAIKVLPTSKVKDPTIFSRFQREGELLTKLDHPNVVRAYRIGESNNRHYIAMEYLEGEPLDETLERRKRLPPPEAVRLIHQCLLGLQHVFERGMVHRDLKPANLVLVPGPGPHDSTFGCTLRILDIGLGRTTFDENSKEPEEQLTTEGALLGTPDYMAPEQARSAHEVDIRSDIYSVGCVFYHLLTGRPPFLDNNVLSQIVKHATEQPKPLSDFLPQVPDGLQQVLNWMMAKDPNQRYPTPDRAAQALQAFLTPAPASLPASRTLPDYLQGFDSSAAVELAPASSPVAAPAPAAAPGGIPVGRLETGPRRKDRNAEQRKDGTAPRAKLAVPVAAPLPVVEPMAEENEYDVEIVAAPPIAPNPPQPVALPKPAAASRGLLDLDRRDYIMAGIGGGLVLTAILAGYGLSRMFRKPAAPSPTTNEETPADVPVYRPRPPAEKKPEEERGDKAGGKEMEGPKDGKKEN